MSREELVNELRELMETDEEINEATVLDDIEEWDSLAALSLMSFAKKEFDCTLTTDDIRGFKTVKDICDKFIG